MINTIVFDLFGVICSEVAPFWFEKYFPRQEAALLKNKYFEPLDSGKTTEEKLFDELSQLVNRPTSTIIKEFDELTIINNDMINLAKKLKPNYKIGLFSNGGSKFVRSILKNYKIEDLFDSIIISAEYGLTKPNIKIYQITLQKLNADFENSLFIDDNHINVKAAKKLGFYTIEFKNYTQCIKELNNFISHKI